MRQNSFSFFRTRTYAEDHNATLFVYRPSANHPIHSEYRGYWIHWGVGTSHIEVGTGLTVGEHKFLSLNYSNPFPVNWLSVSGGNWYMNKCSIQESNRGRSRSQINNVYCIFPQQPCNIVSFSTTLPVPCVKYTPSDATWYEVQVNGSGSSLQLEVRTCGDAHIGLSTQPQMAISTVQVVITQGKILVRYGDCIFNINCVYNL